MKKLAQLLYIIMYIINAIPLQLCKKVLTASAF